jgi:hypothetical protein
MVWRRHMGATAQTEHVLNMPESSVPSKRPQVSIRFLVFLADRFRKASTTVGGIFIVRRPAQDGGAVVDDAEGAACGAAAAGEGCLEGGSEPGRMLCGGRS